MCIRVVVETNPQSTLICTTMFISFKIYQINQVFNSQQYCSVFKGLLVEFGFPIYVHSRVLI